MKITRAVEDYLEALLMLEEEGKPLEITEIAKHLNVSKPAATQMMNELKENGFVEKERYGSIQLTEEGREIGQATLHRHNVLKKLLMSIGVSEELAEEDCCKIEHVISEETFEKIEDFVNRK